MSNDSVQRGQVTEVAHNRAPNWSCVEQGGENGSLHEATEDRGVKALERPYTLMNEA